MKTIFWLNINRFDVKIDKSTNLEMCTGLVKRGYKVILLTSYRDKPYENKSLNFEVVSFASVKLSCFFRIVLMIKMFFYLLKNAKPDDILYCDCVSIPMAYFVKLFKKIKMHLDFRTVYVDIHTIKQKLDLLIYWKMTLSLFLKTADSYSFITEYLKSEVEREFKHSFDDYCIWSSAVNTDMFKSIKEELPGNKSQSPVLFYHGTISRNRGIGTVLEAVSTLIKEKYDIVFRVIGSGPDLDMMKQHAQKLGIDDFVEFSGLIPYEKVPFEIAKADICICPLPNRIEWNVSSPLKVFEYMASGKPVICTPIPAHKDVLKDQPFIVYTADESAEAIKNTIKDCLGRLPELQSYYQDEKAFVENGFTWKRQAEILYDYLVLKYGKVG